MPPTISGLLDCSSELSGHPHGSEEKEHISHYMPGEVNTMPEHKAMSDGL